MSMINQKQVLSLQQKLSPQQIQMIKLLELPTMQLEQRIKQEIEENIVLEEDDHTPEDEQPQQISVEEYLREDETPSYKSRINNYSKDDKPRQAPLAGGRSLQEYLVEQLGYRNLSEQDMRLAVYLVGSIEEDGYLRRSLEAIADDIAFTQGVDVSVEHLERLLSIIHELEPTGVGARNLQECLLIIDSNRSKCMSVCCCNWIRRILIPAPAGWPARSWSAISTSLSKSITKN